MKTATLNTTETFTFTALADGPYEYLGLGLGVSPDGDIVPGRAGFCQHCNTPIVYHFWLKGADSKCFFVGSSCIKKSLTGIQADIVVQVMADRALAEKLRNKNKLEKDFGTACNLISIHADRLAEEPHPKGFEKLSLLNSLAWYKKNAGKKKFVDVAKFTLKKLELWEEK